jgi:DNA-binding MarR family transcriptional regulator
MSDFLGGHEVAMALRRAYLAMHRQTDAALRSSRVTADQFVVLCALAERDALTQRNLVERTSSDANTLRAILVLLEQRSLVRRTPHPADGRARSVSLTTRGRAVLEKLWQQSDAVRQHLLRSLAPGGARPFVAQLLQVIAAMESFQEPHSARQPRPTAGPAVSVRSKKQTHSLSSSSKRESS